MVYLILFTALAAAAFLLVRSRKAAGRSGLRARCLRELRLPAGEAERALQRHLELLRKKHPEKDEEWLLEKFLYDLARDRS
jgi:hypothetical protein